VPYAFNEIGFLLIKKKKKKKKPLMEEAAMDDKSFIFHPRCLKLHLTHLCFANNLYSQLQI